MARKDWVKLPSHWIEAGGLRHFRWTGAGSDSTAALMTLIAIAHHADDQEGVARLTYDDFGLLLGLSRAKISGGLGVLEQRGIIENLSRRSVYRLAGYNPADGWAKLPFKTLYSGDRIAAFDEFKLRSIAELNALKLYLLFASRRGRDTNMANISFDKIQQFAGIERARIKAALTLLAINNMAHVERLPSTTTANATASAYRLIGIDPYNHMGTMGRGLDPAVLIQATAFSE